MATIIYKAKRRLEPSGFLKTGVDISAAQADDSFNASINNLSGLNADQWVKASGFANAGNNSWVQASVNSTSGKIVTVTPPVAHLRLPGVAGNYASTPDIAANSIAGDQGLVCAAALLDWTPASIQTLISKWNTTGNQRAIALSVNTDGTLNLSWSADGTAVISKNSTVATGIADLAIKFIWASLDVDNGAVGNDVKFWLSPDGIAWVQLGATVTTAGTTAVFNSSSGLEVGSINGGTAQLAIGRILYASLVGGLASTPAVAAFDPARGVRGAVSFVASTNETWTINQSGSPAAILQGVALITEAAGAPVTLKGYKRGLNQTYSMEFGIELGDRSSDVKRTKQQPMANVPPEVTFFREEDFEDIRTAKILQSGILQWREMISSSRAGELVTFDKYGTIAAPDNPLQAMIDSDSYTEVREQTNFEYRISLKLRVFE